MRDGEGAVVVHLEGDGVDYSSVNLSGESQAGMTLIGTNVT